MDRRGPRALFGAPTDLADFSLATVGAAEGHLEQPHQFLHVEGHDKFRAGHHRGNLDHHIQDVQQHHGHSHKEEVRICRVSIGYYKSSGVEKTCNTVHSSIWKKV